MKAKSANMPHVHVLDNGNVHVIKATFQGKHNKSKVRALMALNNNPGIDAYELHLLSGVSYEYLLARLGKWSEWGYIDRYNCKSSQRKRYCYSIAPRGKRFLSKVPEAVIKECERY